MIKRFSIIKKVYWIKNIQEILNRVWLSWDFKIIISLLEIVILSTQGFWHSDNLISAFRLVDI